MFIYFTHNSIPRNSTSGNTQKGTDVMIYFFIAGLFIVVEMINRPNTINRGMTQ